MTVAEMLARISSRELTEWMVYYQIEPFGEERADYRMGVETSTMANIHRDRKKRRKAFKPEDFMPKFGARDERKDQTWQEMLQAATMLTVGMGGQDLRSED